MANAVEIVINANDRASSIVTGIQTSFAGIGTAISGKVIPALTAFGSAVLTTTGTAKNGILEIIALIEKTDDLLRRFANTTLQEVVLGVVQNLVNEIADSTQYTLSEVLGSLSQFGKAVAGIGNQVSTSNFVSQAELQSAKISALAEKASVEFDLVALKVQTVGKNAVDLGLEFDIAKSKLSSLGKALNVDVSQEIDLLSLRFQNLGEQLNLSLDFDTNVQNLSDTVDVELDLLKLRVEQFNEGEGINIFREFEKSKARIQEISKALEAVAPELSAKQRITAEINAEIEGGEKRRQIIGEIARARTEDLDSFSQAYQRAVQRQADLLDGLFKEATTEGGTELNQQLNRLAQNLSQFSQEQGINLQFNSSPIESGVKRSQLSISQFLSQVAQETAVNISSATSFLLNNFDKTFLQLRGIVERDVKGITDSLGSISGIAFNFSGADELLGFFGDIQGQVSPLIDGISQIGFQISNIQSVMTILNPIVASGPFQLLIQQNIDLREQLLATQATLAGTNKVFQGGIQVEDPGAAIKTLEKPVEDAIARIREGSLELAGVTSSQLIESFRIVSSQVGGLGIGLNDAADLTLDFAAGLTTLGIPLFQANQEISSILTGTIDVNSVLAKALNITNEQVQLYKTQGTLVEFLSKRLSAFRAGNVELSKTFSGVTSNIQEVVELIGLQAGKTLLQPLVDELTEIYNVLNESRSGITAFVADIGENLFEAVRKLVDALGGLFASSDLIFINSIEILFNAITSAINTLADSIEFATTIFEPFISILGALSSLVPTFLNPLIILAVQFQVLNVGVGLLTGGFARFAKGLPLVGELLFLMEQRSSGLIGLLTGLTKSTEIGAASFLTLGASLTKIPFLFNIVSQKIPIFGEQIAAIIPIVSQFGIAGLGLSQKLIAMSAQFPLLKVAIDGVSGSFNQLIKAGGPISNVINNLRNFADSNEALKPFVPLIEQLENRFNTLGSASNIAALANQKFAETTALLRQQLTTTLTRIALISAGVYVVVAAINEYVIQNKELIETLSAIGSGLAEFAKGITDLIVSPAGLATIAIAATTAALITFRATLINIAKVDAVLFVTNLNKVVGLLKSLTVTATVLGGANFGVIFRQAALGVSALSVSAASGTVTIGTLAVALKGLVVAAVAAAAPFALIAGGIASIGLIRYTKDLQDSTEATRVYAATTDTIALSALNFANTLKGVRDGQKKIIEEGKELTKEQIKQNQNLLEQSRLRVQDIDTQIAALQAARETTKGDENKAALDAQIAQLQKVKGAVESFATEVRLSGDPITQLTNRIKFLDEQLKRFNATIDAEQKEAIANLTEGLQQGVFTQSQVEEKKVELTRAGLEKQLAETDKGLQELQSRYAKLSPEEVERAREVQDAITAKRAESADIRTKITEIEIEQQQKAIDKASKKALEQVEAAEKQRAILIQQLRNSDQISPEDTAALEVENRKAQIKGELDAEKNRLTELLKNENLNSDAIKESRKKILDLTLSSLKAEEDAYDAYTNRVKASLDRQVTDRQIALQNSVNQGLITEEAANEERIRLDVARLQAELRAETRNADRRRQLTLELAQAEGQLREATIASIDRKLNDSAQKFENNIKSQNAELEKQLGLYDLLGTALQTQSELLDAQKNLLGAAQGFLTGQVDAISSLERSENKRRQLAQITAAIQLDSLAQRQATERRIFEIQQQQNKLALERQRIENEIAIAQKEAEVARAQAQVVRGEEELRRGKITQPEFEARQLELQATQQGLLALQRQRSVIQEQFAIQPQLEAAARQQFELQQRYALTDAQVQFANTLRPGQLRQVRGALQNQFAQSLGFEGQFDLRQQGLGAVRNLIGDIRAGRQADAGLFDRLTPNTQGLVGGLEQTLTELPSQFGNIARQNLELSQGLENTIQEIRRVPQTLESRPTPQLQIPTRELLNIEQIRQQQQAELDKQSRAPSLTAEQVKGIADAFWQRFGGSGTSETKIEAPINVVVNPQPGENAQAAADAVDQRLKQVVERANQIVRTTR